MIEIWLDNNDILMYLTYNESKSVIAERFIKTWKNKIYKKRVPNDRYSYRDYLEGLLEDYDNTYHFPIGKSLSVLTILLCMKKLNQIIGFINIVLLI